MSPGDPIKDEMARKVAAYKDLFLDPEKAVSARIVLADLHEFCAIYASGENAKGSVLRQFAGRRAVFLRIQNSINLTPEAIERLVMMEDTELTERGKEAYDPLQRNT